MGFQISGKLRGVNAVQYKVLRKTESGTTPDQLNFT